MKQFIIKSIVFLLLIIFILSFILILMSRYPDQCSLQSHEINVRVSAERLSQIDTTKIVIIGGSGCGFGFNSQIIFNHYHVPVINTGTHASIGIIMQLKMYEKYFRKGDVVLIIPEYQQFTNKFAYGIEDQTLYRILYNNYPDALKYLTIYQTINIVKYIPKYFLDAIAHRDMIFDTISPYSKSSLNEFGDVASWKCRNHTSTISSHTIHNACFNDDIIDIIKDFMQTQEGNGVKCMLFPPTYMDASYENSELFIDTLSVALLHHGIPFVTSTVRYKFVDSLFYDTDYHLTYKGATLRTQMIVEDIDSCLNLTSECSRITSNLRFQ